jgi:hypothetical protein
LRDRELEDRIKTHMDKIQQHRNKAYDDIAGELASARRNLEQVSIINSFSPLYYHLCICIGYCVEPSEINP